MFVCGSEIECDRSFCIVLTSNEPHIKGGQGRMMLITELAQNGFNFLKIKTTTDRKKSALSHWELSLKNSCCQLSRCLLQND